jgi:hypothetical protein
MSSLQLRCNQVPRLIPPQSPSENEISQYYIHDIHQEEKGKAAGMKPVHDPMGQIYNKACRKQCINNPSDAPLENAFRISGKSQKEIHCQPEEGGSISDKESQRLRRCQDTSHKEPAENDESGKQQQLQRLESIEQDQQNISVSQVPPGRYLGPGTQQVDIYILRLEKICIQLTVENDIHDIANVPEQDMRKPVCGRSQRPDKHHIMEGVAFNDPDAVEYYPPEKGESCIVQYHTQYLKEEAAPVLHGCCQVEPEIPANQTEMFFNLR